MLFGNTQFMKKGMAFRKCLSSAGKRIGKAFDIVLFTVLVTSGIAILFRGRNHFGWILSLTAASILLLHFLWTNQTEKKQKEMQLKKMKNEILLEKLMLTPDETIKTVLTEKELCIIRKMDPDKGEILSAIMNKPKLLICCDSTPDLELLLHSYSPETALLNYETAIERLQLKCTQEELENRLLRMRRSSKTIRKRNRQLQLHKYRFLLLGVLLLVLSVVTNYKIYYRLLSSVCLIISTISAVFGTARRRNIFL